VATEALKVEDGKPPRKRSRRQGVSSKGGVVTNEIVDNKYDVAIANAVSFLKQIETADGAEAEHPIFGSDTEVIYCEKCKDAGTDMAVPRVLLPLHDLIVHSDKGAEIS
jgi:hypothetical protein